MIEFLLGWMLGRQGSASRLEGRPTLDLAGVHRHRPLQAWAFWFGRALGRGVGRVWRRLRRVRGAA